jgi:peroxiredoxin
MFRSVIVAAVMTAVAAPALAALPDGAQAPTFTTQGALAGKTRTISLSAALKKGPVVLYFFPAAFTKGCTIEAHDFAEATSKFQQLGATVIGITAGNINRVADFSSVECRNKFMVAADPGAKIAAKYDAKFNGALPISNRTSYAIAPNGKIVASYTDMNPDKHVEMMLQAVKSLRHAG